ncbi:ABC transporter permease [Paenibacillus sp. J31TS4]|uniref:ABC transporter permease n=1 Tax=Paenibacillus sp. J31TS4 TaxID=2807195 RepID=UPI001B03BDFD|nr:ABC transporter permease [Paenibacillus sp. J31TS4]GIP40014.1 ABC transporter permease [Paenibacillus sp. J31TS4]
MFFALVRNELMKLHSKRQTRYFYLFLIIVLLGAGFVFRFGAPETAARIDQMDFASNMYAGLSLFVTVFALAIGAQSVSEEYRDGTIKQLLIRPSSRTSILLSKFVAVLLVLLAADALIVAGGLLIGTGLFGIQADTPPALVLIKTAVYDLPRMVFLTSLSFFLGVALRGIGLALSVSLIAYFVGGLVSMMVSKYRWSKLLIFRHTDLAVYDPDPLVSGGGMPPAGFTLGLSLTVIAAYIALLLGLSMLVFAKRDVR